MSQRQNLDEVRREFTARQFDGARPEGAVMSTRIALTLGMRAAFAVVVVAASLSGLACDCPRRPEVVAKRRTVGDLQYQIDSEVMARDLEKVDGGACSLDDDDAG